MLYLRAIMRNWRAMISPYLWYYNSNVIRYELLLMIHGWKVLAYDISSNIELVFDISNLNINLYEVDLFCSTNMYDKIIYSFNSIQKRYLKIITNYELSSLGPSKYVNNTTTLWWPSKFTNYLPWGHPNMWTIQQLFIHIYKTTQANTTYTFIQKLILNSYNVYTIMYIHHTLIIYA